MRQAGALRMLASTSWEYDHQNLRINYIAIMRSMVEYGASSWLPWISNSILENQERSQLFAGRAIPGQIRTFPVEALHAESNLPSIKKRAIQLIAITMVKSLRTTLIYPRHAYATQWVRQRTHILPGE